MKFPLETVFVALQEYKFDVNKILLPLHSVFNGFFFIFNYFYQSLTYAIP